MDNYIFNFFYSFSYNSFISQFAFFLSYPFTYIVILLLIIWAIFLSKNKIYNFSLLFLSGFFSWVVSSILKVIWHVNRPFITLHLIPLYRETGFSFPSNHMAVFTAIAFSMFSINKKAGFVFLLIAFLVGFSRIIIGVHYPVDILGGFVVGFIISLIFREIFKKI